MNDVTPRAAESRLMDIILIGIQGRCKECHEPCGTTRIGGLCGEPPCHCCKPYREEED